MKDILAELNSLAIFGARPLFEQPRSTSNLLQPDVEKFLAYSRLFVAQRHYTNNGPLVRLLEARLAAFHQTGFCVSFCSGFWAIALTLRVLALAGRSEIVMPSLTYRRMSDIAAWVRLKPRFCEVDVHSLAATVATVDACINADTAVILVAHPIVNCCDAAALAALAEERGIPIVFDSVESVYESLPAGRVGGFGAAEAFSLHACKLLNGFGGGYITTNDGALAQRLALMRGFGFQGADNVVVADGMNAKLNEMHAAMALASLDDLEAQIERNRARYRVYQSVLAGMPGIRLVEFDESQSAGFKNIVVELLPEWPLSRADTVRVLNAEGILARSYYDPPLHRKPMQFPHIPAELPVTDAMSRRFLNLPCGQKVDEADIRAIGGMLELIRTCAPGIAARLAAQESQEKMEHA